MAEMISRCISQFKKTVMISKKLQSKRSKKVNKPGEREKKLIILSVNLLEITQRVMTLYTYVSGWISTVKIDKWTNDQRQNNNQTNGLWLGGSTKNDYFFVCLLFYPSSTKHPSNPIDSRCFYLIPAFDNLSAKHYLTLPDKSRFYWIQ